MVIEDADRSGYRRIGRLESRPKTAVNVSLLQRELRRGFHRERELAIGCVCEERFDPGSRKEIDAGTLAEFSSKRQPPQHRRIERNARQVFAEPDPVEEFE